MDKHQQYPILKPPLWFLIFLILGSVSNEVFPWSLLTSANGVFYGCLIFVVGVGLMVYMHFFYLLLGEQLDASVSTEKILCSGPFLYSRNPTYVGMLLAFLGLALAFNNAWLLVNLVIFSLQLHFAVVLKEEQYLAQQFGEPYRQYQAQVRRWL